MSNLTGYIKIDNDKWDDVGKIYKVLSYHRRDPNSTAVELKLEQEDGTIVERVEAIHAIEWIEDGDW